MTANDNTDKKPDASGAEPSGPDARNNKGETDREERRSMALGMTLVLILIVCLVVFVAWGIYQAAFPPSPPLQGQMESRTISVSSKVPGRVQKVLVKEGDFVKAGQPVAEMSLPELEAKLAQVQAQERAAKAKQDLVDDGARPQEKEAAKAQWQRAQAASELARKTYDRVAALYKDGLVSTQKYDEAQTSWVVAEQQATAAMQQYEIARIGAREQEKAAAADLSSQAAAGVSEVQSLTENKILNAPLAAQVDKVILVEGELAASGFPVVTLVDLNDQWASFNIRESEMPGIEIGKILKATVPAIGDKEVEYKVYYISPRANYATWRSTRQDSGYDMKTFEVRARPVGKIGNLRPGMSVLVAR